MIEEVFQEVKYMCYTGIFKRIIPFVLTFAAGLLLASLFVSITPNFNGWRGDRGGRRGHDKRQLLIENESLRERLRASEQEIRELRRGLPDRDAEFVIPEVAPPVELEAHHPPTPPKRPKHPRFE